jgi:very-short-patch-repair endonuclease
MGKSQRNRRKSRSLKEVAVEYSDRLSGRMTKAEKYFNKLLKGINIPCKPQKIIYKKPSFYIIDFYIKSRNLCVEIDGGYHQTPEQMEKDCLRDEWLKGNGYCIWRMTNEEAFDLTKEELRVKLESYPLKTIGSIKILTYEEPIPKLSKPKKKPHVVKKKVKRPRPVNTCPALDKMIANKRARDERRSLVASHGT